MSNTKEYSAWVKKFGQYHLYKAGESVTLCGAPMLGNNYARHIHVQDRKPCPECFKEAKIDQ